MKILELPLYLVECPEEWKNMINHVKKQHNDYYDYDNAIRYINRELKKYHAVKKRNIVTFKDDKWYTLWLLKWNAK